MNVHETPELHAAVQAAREGAQLALSARETLSLSKLEKADLSPVTVTDFTLQALISHRLMSRFPEIPIIAEEEPRLLEEQPESIVEGLLELLTPAWNSVSRESALDAIAQGSHREASGMYWTVDPIDGTKGFLKGKQFAVAIALVNEGVVEVSAVACARWDPDIPHDKDSTADAGAGWVCYGARGRGAWRLPVDPAASDVPVPLEVSPCKTASDVRFVESSDPSHARIDINREVASSLGITLAPRPLHSMAKYASVATGASELYMRVPVRQRFVEKIWDHAPGALLVEEAGGRVTDLTGEPLRFAGKHELTENRGIVVTNSLVHDDVLNAIARIDLP